MIIGLSGYAQVGKDTVANYLVEKYGFVKVSFADPIREALLKLDPHISDYPGLPNIKLSWIVKKGGWEEVKANSPYTRNLLQRLGTEVGREMFGDDFWVTQGLLRAKEHDRVVFADVRFPNEALAIKHNNGLVWRVNKKGHAPVNLHPSEVALDNFDFDNVLLNNSDINELQKNVDNIMQSQNSLQYPLTLIRCRKGNRWHVGSIPTWRTYNS